MTGSLIRVTHSDKEGCELDEHGRVFHSPHTHCLDLVIKIKRHSFREERWNED